jgi:hypothetical protein
MFKTTFKVSKYKQYLEFTMGKYLLLSYASNSYPSPTFRVYLEGKEEK